MGARAHLRSDGICPPDHPHAASTNCYIYHRCPCAPCRNGHVKYQRDRRAMLGADVNLDPRGTTRRLQALARAGWSKRQLGLRSGMLRQHLGKLRQGGRPVRAVTVERVKALYRECLTDTPSVDRRTLEHAIAQGWHAGTCWVDIDRDDAPDCGGECLPKGAAN